MHRNFRDASQHGGIGQVNTGNRDDDSLVYQHFGRDNSGSLEWDASSDSASLLESTTSNFDGDYAAHLSRATNSQPPSRPYTYHGRTRDPDPISEEFDTNVESDIIFDVCSGFDRY